jgi:hypothetical protein
MNRSDTAWCHIPDDTTVDDIVERLWLVVCALCECGGSGPGEGGCRFCEIWHYVTGNQDELTINETWFQK